MITKYSHPVLKLQTSYSVLKSQLGFTVRACDLNSVFLLHQLLLIVNYQYILHNYDCNGTFLSP